MTADGGSRSSRGHRRGTLCTSGLLVWTLLGTSCQTSAAPGPALPNSPTVVAVSLSEYRIVYEPVVPSGRVVFRIKNKGRIEHQLTLLPLPDDLPPFDQQLRGSERRFISPFAEVPSLQPGRTSAFAVDLVPGRRYALACFLIDPDGQSHALEGMSLEFRVSNDSSTDSLPSQG